MGPIRQWRSGTGQFQRRLLHAAIMAAFSGMAAANPSAPTVVSGQASFTQRGNTLAITNTPNAIINWQSFSINANETTRFVQQSAASAVLNRVTGVDPSVILGTLQSNGRVFLINPSGIVFGQGSRVDVAGLVASTLNLNNQDFQAGRLNFTGGAVAGGITSAGTISTPAGGSVILVAPRIENSGIITAPNGDVILAAGRTVRLGDTAAPDVLVEIQAPDTHAVNVGEIIVGAGNASIYAGLISQKGVVSANSAGVNAAGKIVFKATHSVTAEAGSRTTANGGSGGQIALQSGDGATLVSGELSATGTIAAGGNIRLLGTDVGVAGNARVDASGATAGGTILMGGDYKGANPDVPNARATFLGEGATLAANGLDSGNGGTIILWSNEVTRVFGSVQARGGASGGNGGFVETSSAGTLLVPVAPDLSAPAGAGGTWLIDPSNITVAAGTILSGNRGAPDFTASDDNSRIGANLIAAQLNAGISVKIRTTGAGKAAGDITIAAPIIMNSATAREGSLTLIANNNINIDAAIANEGSARLSLSMIALGDIKLNQPISVATGSFTANGIVEGTGKPVMTISTLTMQSWFDSIGSAANPILTSQVASLTATALGGGIAITNTGGAQAQPLNIAHLTSVGGPISLTSDARISVNDTCQQACVHTGNIDAFGGSITLRSTGGDIVGNGAIRAGAFALDPGNRSDGGNITLYALKGIDFSGSIDASGNAVAGKLAGQGGHIDIQTPAAVDLGTVISLGANGISGAPFGSAGGTGGNISISGGGRVSIRSIVADGGIGGAARGDNRRAGVGGAGGNITIRTSGSSINVNSLSAAGGSGGGADQVTPGNGGDGGSVVIRGDGPALTLAVTDAISVRGGNGGSGSGHADSNGGQGGSIDIYLASPGTLDVGAALLSARGGDSGTDTGTGLAGAGGSIFLSSTSASTLQHVGTGTEGTLTLNGGKFEVGPGEGAGAASGYVHLQSGDGGIGQQAAVVFDTEDLRIASSGSVILGREDNVIPGIWGQVEGNLAVGTNGPINLASAGTLEVGGDLIAQARSDINIGVDRDTTIRVGDLSLAAGRNIRLSNSDISAKGLTSITAGGDLTIESHGPFRSRLEGEGMQTLAIGGDLVMMNSAAADSRAALSGKAGQTISARSIRMVGANGGGWVVIENNSADVQSITTTGAGANGWGIELTNNGASTVHIQSAGSQSITASDGDGILVHAVRGEAAIVGGGQFDTQRSFQPQGTQTIAIDGPGENALVVRAGSAAAWIAGAEQSITAGSEAHPGSILVEGGTGPGATASIFNYSGAQNITGNSISLKPGSGLDADAVILGPNGPVTVTATDCPDCVTLASNPLGNGRTDVGVFGMPVVGETTAPPPVIPVDPSVVYAINISSDAGLGNTHYQTSAMQKENDSKDSSKNESQDRGTTPKAKLPICM